ncbi:MAG: hypothetical protein ACFCUS_13800 [Rubrimonas sp.]|uniref:tetratricopeptide repeat protein n=1 Tax=Rubrimonas sp. TaxID=2036015 RepID=UPI002FDEB717
MNGESSRITPQAAREALERVLASPDFDASSRNRRFLVHVVEETLAGRADRIKAYAIATSAFGRSADFDPQTDPIVRIEALRLRRALERHYLLSGRDDPVRITIPKGSYVPSFSYGSPPREPSEAAARPPRPDQRRTPSITVLTFQGDAEDGPRAARGFTRQVIGALSRFGDLDVYGSAGSQEHRSAQPGRSDREVDYVLGGAVLEDGERFRVEALLSDARTGRHLWGETLERPLDPAALHAARDEVSDRVARLVAQPWGLIHAARAREARDHPPEHMNSYDCVMRFYQYLRSYDRALHAEALACLERVVAAEPEYAEAVACLSLALTDASRFGYPAGATADPIARALELGATAVDLAPHSSRSHHALGMARWFAGDVPGALEALEAGRALNPNDTETMADLGTRLVFRGEWARGRVLIAESFARNPGQPGVFCVGLALEAFAHGRFEEALAYARRVTAPTLVYGDALVAIAAAKLGLREEAARAVSRMLAIDPSYGGKVEDDLAARNLEPGLAREVVAALRLAGLPEDPAPGHQAG